MVEKTAVGITGEPFELDVERGKIDEFARATRAGHPAHFAREGAVIPATFLMTRMFWQQRVPGSDPWERVAMSQERGLHAEQEFRFHGPPPRAGDRLLGTSRIDDVWEKQGRRGGTLTFVKMVTEYRDPQGKLVAEAIMTGVETSQPPEEES